MRIRESCVALGCATGAVFMFFYPDTISSEEMKQCQAIEAPQARADCAFAIEKLREDVTDGVTVVNDVGLVSIGDDEALATAVEDHSTEDDGIVLDEEGVIIRGIDKRLDEQIGDTAFFKLHSKLILAPGLAIIGVAVLVKDKKKS